MKLKILIISILISGLFVSCKDQAFPCIDVEREAFYMGAPITLINCSESQVRVDFNKTDEITEWESFESSIVHSYTRPGTYSMEFEFNKDGFTKLHDISVDVSAPSIDEIKGEWRLWRFEDRDFNPYPGLERADPFESILEQSWEVDASWNIGDTAIKAKPDLNLCLLCFGPENYTYFDDQAELSVGSILSSIVYFDSDSMILDAGYGGDPFLIYMSRL